MSAQIGGHYRVSTLHKTSVNLIIKRFAESKPTAFRDHSTHCEEETTSAIVCADFMFRFRDTGTIQNFVWMMEDFTRPRSTKSMLKRNDAFQRKGTPT